MSHKAWRIFKSKEEYDEGMARLLELAEGELTKGSAELDEFELLTLLIENYDEKHFPMAKPDPIEAIKFRMDQQGLTQADMRQYIGSASKVSEVLNYKRALSLSMIKRLHTGLGIPADILIGDVENIEWSPISEGTENLYLAFGDTCKKMLQLATSNDNPEKYQEVASSQTTINFKTNESRRVENPKTTISINNGFYSVAAFSS